MKHFLFWVLIISSIDYLNAQSVHLPNTPGFHMVEKSGPQWVTLGQTITLKCKTNELWNLCRWIKPNNQSCDRRRDELYNVGCIHDPRVRFQKPSWHVLSKGRSMSTKQIDNLKNECTIEISEAN